MARDHALLLASWPAAALDHEPAHGFFQRLAAANKQVSVRTLASYLGLNGRNLNPKEMLEFCYKLPIANLDGLASATPEIQAEHALLYGQKIRRRDLSFSTPRVCPGCLVESRHYRTWWDLTLVRACPIHNQQLITDVSGSKLAWWFPATGVTEDGHVVGLSDGIAPSYDCAWESYVLGRLDILEFASFARDSELYEVADTAMLIGAVELLTLDPTARPSFFEPSSRAELAAAGFSYLSAGRRGLESLFFRFERSRWEQEPCERRRARRWFKQRLEFLTSSSLRELVETSFEAATDCISGAPCDSMGSELSGAQQRLCRPISLNTLSLRLGLSKRCTRSLVKRLNFEAIKSTTNHSFLFDVAMVTECESVLDSLVTREEATTRARLTPKAFDAACRSLGVQPFVHFGRLGIRFLKADVDRVGASKGELPRSDLLPGSYRPRRRTARPGVSLTRAGTIIGIPSCSVAAYADAGLIENLNATRASGRQLLSLPSVQEFSTRFVPARFYAGFMGCSPGAVGWKFKSLGILPLTVPGLEKCPVYERSTVESILGVNSSVIRLGNTDWAASVFEALRENILLFGNKIELSEPFNNAAKINGGCKKTAAMLSVDALQKKITLLIEAGRDETPRRFALISDRLKELKVAWPTAVIDGNATGNFIVVRDTFPQIGDPVLTNVVHLREWLDEKVAFMRWIFVHGSRGNPVRG